MVKKRELTKEERWLEERNRGVDFLEQEIDFIPEPSYRFNIGDKVACGRLKDATVEEILLDETTEEQEWSNPSDVIKNVAQEIAEVLESCQFNNIQDSSGYYVIREFADGTDRAVDVYKSTNGGHPHYVVYCSYEDEEFDYVHTDDLSVESLIETLTELQGERESMER